MKKITKILLFLILALTSFAYNGYSQDCYTPKYSGGNNLTPNPSFDGDFASSGFTKGWTDFDPKSTENSCGTDATGSLYLKGGCYPNGGVLEFVSGVAIVPGHQYEIVATIKNETAADNAFNFHLPGGVWDLPDTNNHSSSVHLVGIPQGTGWVEFSATVTAGANASGTVQMLFMSCDSFVDSTISDLIYLDNFQIYDLDDLYSPIVTVSKSQLSFNESNTQLTFDVTGNNLAQDITLTAPVGITLDVTTIAYDSASTPTTITATWDEGANILNQLIYVASYTESKQVDVIASLDSPCFMPIDANLNLISDPTMRDRSNYGGWGRVSTEVGYASACGATSILLDPVDPNIYSDGGSAFDINGITFEPNTQYGLQFMFKTVGGHVAMNLFGGGVTATWDDNSSALLELSTSDAWVNGSYSFTTGADPSNLAITFNSVDLVTNSYASEVHIDNLELYNLTALSTDKTVKNALSIKLYPNPVKNVLNIDTNLEVSKISIYDLLGRVVMPNISLNNSKSINVSSLSSGAYILHATLENKVQVIKFIK
ncbi:T9SS type A sorting domain-containing protein [Thalassobellus suaedae]|uniref:T9SS type A sorting domain-containing protein n=1 Tax=Thalassobellus suaedae TaxID=3074124 RepID=A0ABY9XXH9_9FLAO|nr:T9SS type A sorting domain-containing protein [Flavobacteriaceae bacterium HL-DH14]